MATHLAAGVVSKLSDTKPGLVQVRFPHLKGTPSGWYKVVTPGGGPGRGFVCLPEVGDAVMIGFEHGDMDRGFVLGAVWHDSQKPPALAGKPADNNQRLLRSRCGHQITLDDTAGAERVEVRDKDGRRVVLDSKAGTIEVVCPKGDVTVSAENGAVTIKARKALKLSGATVEIEAKAGNVSIQAAGAVKVVGKPITLN